MIFQKTQKINPVPILMFNGNAVAGDNIYRASSPAGPYSKVNAEPVTSTEYVDSSGGVGMDAGEGGSAASYYAVTPVDSAGAESALSLGISPANLASSAQAVATACFVDTISGSMPKQRIWLGLLLIIGVAVGCRRQALGKMCKAHGKTNRTEC